MALLPWVPSSHLLVLPSPSLTGQAVSLPGDSVSGIVEHFLDLRQGHDLGVVVDVDSLRRDIDLDLAHTFQFDNCSLDRVLAMLTRNIGGDQCRRFHETYPPLMRVNHLKSKRCNPPLHSCSRSQLYVVDERLVLWHSISPLYLSCRLRTRRGEGSYYGFPAIE